MSGIIMKSPFPENEICNVLYHTQSNTLAQTFFLSFRVDIFDIWSL